MKECAQRIETMSLGKFIGLRWVSNLHLIVCRTSQVAGDCLSFCAESLCINQPRIMSCCIFYEENCTHNGAHETNCFSRFLLAS